MATSGRTHVVAHSWIFMTHTCSAHTEGVDVPCVLPGAGDLGPNSFSLSVVKGWQSQEWGEQSVYPKAFLGRWICSCISVYLLCVCACVCMCVCGTCMHECVHTLQPRHTCGGQRTICRRWFSLSNMWVPGTEDWLSGLVTPSLSCMSPLSTSSGGGGSESWGKSLLICSPGDKAYSFIPLECQSEGDRREGGTVQECFRV